MCSMRRSVAGPRGRVGRRWPSWSAAMKTLYQQIKPVLDAIGDKVTYIGEIGCGTIAKIVHNMVSLCSRVAIAEGLTLGVKAGVSPRALLDAIQRGSFGQGRVLKESIPETVFKGDFDNVSFALKLSRKISVWRLSWPKNITSR